MHCGRAKETINGVESWLEELVSEKNYEVWYDCCSAFGFSFFFLFGTVRVRNLVRRLRFLRVNLQGFYPLRGE